MGQPMFPPRNCRDALGFIRSEVEFIHRHAHEAGQHPGSPDDYQSLEDAIVSCLRALGMREPEAFDDEGELEDA